MTDMTNNKIPFGLLEPHEQKALKDWKHGWEWFSIIGWEKTSDPSWTQNVTYRTLPAPKVKEMTVEEVSKALGYEVKIVK